jgi:hypothetical protein
MARDDLYALGYDAPCNMFSWAAPLTQMVLMYIAIGKGLPPMQLFYSYSTAVGALLGTDAEHPVAEMGSCLLWGFPRLMTTY